MDRRKRLPKSKDKKRLWAEYIRSGLTLEQWKEKKENPALFRKKYGKVRNVKPQIIKKNKNKRSRRREYTKYLLSKKWKEKREEAFAYYGKKCDVCGTDKNLHVHHKTYARFKNELISDLQVLCSFHHMELHEKMDREKEQNKINKSLAKNKQDD